MVLAPQLLNVAEEKQTATLTGLTFSLSPQIQVHTQHCLQILTFPQTIVLSSSRRLSPHTPTLLLSPQAFDTLLLLMTLS